MKKNHVSGLILAAGKGTRMKSDNAKVLHEILSAPMIHHVLDTVRALSLDETVVVVGHQKEKVMAALKNYPVSFAAQDQQLGTGHAVLCAESKLKGNDGTILILCGDVPLVRPETLKNMLEDHHKKSPALTVMTTVLSEPTGYGRIVSDSTGRVLRIVEEKDATAAEKKIKEINAGIYCADAEFLFDGLREVGSNNSQGEIYLTDIVGIAIDRGLTVNRFSCSAPEEVLGVNSMNELAAAQLRMRMRSKV